MIKAGYKFIACPMHVELMKYYSLRVSNCRLRQKKNCDLKVTYCYTYNEKRDYHYRDRYRTLRRIAPKYRSLRAQGI